MHVVMYTTHDTIQYWLVNPYIWSFKFKCLGLTSFLIYPIYATGRPTDIQYYAVCCQLPFLGSFNPNCREFRVIQVYQFYTSVKFPSNA